MKGSTDTVGSDTRASPPAKLGSSVGELIDGDAPLEPSTSGVAVGQLVILDGVAERVFPDGSRSVLKTGDDVDAGDTVHITGGPALLRLHGDAVRVALAPETTASFPATVAELGGASEDAPTASLVLNEGAAVLLPNMESVCPSPPLAVTAAGTTVSASSVGAFIAVVSDFAESLSLIVTDVEISFCEAPSVVISTGAAVAMITDMGFLAHVSGATGEISVAPMDVAMAFGAPGTLLASWLIDWANSVNGISDLSKEDLAELLAFETAAGGESVGSSSGAEPGFVVDVLPVTLPQDFTVRPPDAVMPFGKQVDGIVSESANPPSSDHSPVEIVLTAPAPTPTISPTRIRVLSQDDWSFVSGGPWTALLPTAERLTTSFYRVDSVPVQETSAGVNGFLRFQSAGDGPGALAMSMAEFSSLGGNSESAAADMAEFLGRQSLNVAGEGHDPVAGMVAKKSVGIAQNDAIMFRFLFDPENGSRSQSGSDVAFVGVDDVVLPIADTTKIDGAASGWRVAVVHADSGIQSFALGLLNLGASTGDPQLLIDDVRTIARTEGAIGEVVNIDGEMLQIIDVVADPSGDASATILAPQPTALYDTAGAMVLSGVPFASQEAGAASVLANDTAPAPSHTTLVKTTDDGFGDMVPFDYALRVAAVDGNAVGSWVSLEQADGTYGGRIRLFRDGHYEYDPDGAFARLPRGELKSVSVDYTVEAESGGWDVATLTLTIVGDEMIDDFEGASPRGEILAASIFLEGVSSVSVVDRYVEPPFGDSRTFDTLDGTEQFLRLSSYAWNETHSVAVGRGIGDLVAFTGVDLTDPENVATLARYNHEPIGGSAVKYDLVLQPGDVLSFYWAFDNGDLPSSAGAGEVFNDLAALIVDGTIHPLISGRDVDPPGVDTRPGSTSIMFTTFTVPSDVSGEVNVAFWVSDDVANRNDNRFTPEPTTLLVDTVQVSPPGSVDVPGGYQVVDPSAAGPLVTYADVAAG